MILHKLVAEDYTGVGGNMGSQQTFVIFEKSYSSVTKAKAAAEGDYRKREKNKAAKITWQKNGQGITSGDLLYICYTITKEKVL